MNSRLEQKNELVPTSIITFKDGDCSTILYANTKFYEFIGYSEQSFKNTFENNFINIVHKQDRYKLFAIGQNTYHSCCIRVLCGDQNIKWAFITTELIENTKDKYFVGLLDVTEKQYLKENIGVFNDEIMYLLDNIPGGLAICHVDDGLTIIDGNSGFYNLFGANKNSLYSEYKNQLKNMIYEEQDKNNFLDLIKNCSIGDNVSRQLKFRDIAGENKWVWVNCLVKENIVGSRRLYCFFFDITNQKKCEERLEVGRTIYDIAFSQTQDIVYEWNCSTGEVYYSENYKRKFGYEPITNNFPQSVLDEKNVHPDDEEIFYTYFGNLRCGVAQSPVEYRIRKDNGKYIWCRVSAQAIKDSEGQIQKVIGMICDNDKQKKKVLKAQELAKRDPLTGLYNHGATEELISEYLKEEKEFAVLMIIDIDNFKKINDTQGHIYGDAVLTEFAYRLKTIFRKNDIIGRFGGDEFVVFLSKIDEGYDIDRSAREVLSIFKNDFFKEDQNLKISASIGISKFSLDGSTYKEIFKKADLALYFAKNNGKNTYSIYHEYMGDSMLRDTNITKITNERMVSNKTYGNNIGEYIFRIFYENPDVEKAIPILLELVGKSMNASRVYIFEYNENQSCFINTFEWCNKEINSMKIEPSMQRLNMGDVFGEEFLNSDVFYCKDVFKLVNTKLKKWLKKRKAKSTMIYKVFDEDKVAALVGLEQCEKMRACIQQENDAVTLLSNMISLFLIKKRKNEALKLHKAMSKKLLDHIKAFFYVIEPTTYKILYFDKNGSSTIPDSSVGKICYNVFRNSNKPCKDCPLFGIAEDKLYSITQIYNPDLKMWTENHASIINWENGEQAYLISSMDISKYKNNDSLTTSQTNDLKDIFFTKAGALFSAKIWGEELIRNYQFLDSNIPGGMLSAYLEKDFPLIFINRRMLDYLGYKDTKEFVDCTGGLVINCVHEEDRAKTEQAIRKSIEKKQHYEIVYRMLKKDGSCIWICEKGKKVCSLDGKEAILCVCIDITSTKEAEKQLVDNNLRLGVVIEQTNICVWDYDIGAKQMVHTQSSKNRYNIKRNVIDNFSYSVLESNRIHENSINEFQSFFEKIMNGENPLPADICFWDDVNNCWCWEHIVCKIFYNNLGQPIRAIGIGQNITKQKEAEIKFSEELKLMNSLSEGVIGTFKANITTNLLEYVQSTQREDKINELVTYNGLLSYIQEFIVNTEEKEKINSIFKRENILYLHKKGEKSIQTEFRTHDIKGNISWVCANVNISQDKHTGHIHAFGTIRDVNESKKLELSLNQKVEKDSVTRVYNRETTILIISDAMKRLYCETPKNVMILFTIENYKEIILKSGEKATNKMLLEISKILKNKFGKMQIIGRFYSDSFLLFVGGHTKMWIDQTTKNVVQLLKIPYFFADIKVPIRFSVGVAQQSDHLENFEKLYYKANLASRIASSKRKDGCIFYHNDLDCATSDDPELMNLKEEQNKKNKHKDTVLLGCATALVSIEDLALGIDKTLKDVSDYYESPHVFIAELHYPNKQETEIYEYINCNENERYNCQKHVQEVFANWIQLLKNDGIIMANQKKEIESLYGKKFEFINNVLMVPLSAKGEVFGLMCMENLKDIKVDLSLFSSVSAFLSTQLVKKQLYLQKEHFERHDLLTGMLNRDSYLDDRISIKEDVLSSLGLAVIDINGLRKINKRYGLPYGDNMLKFVADKLKKHFQNSRIYRFGEDEFVILSQNITQESFERTCKRFVNGVHQNCTVGVSIGNVWADSNINLDNMMKHADERMMISKMEYYKDTESLNRHHNPSILKSLFTAIEHKEFKMYLQPKADVDTNKIIGAEALVRRYSEKKGIIFPDKFIPQMEEDGTIKYLDLFMFEEVCRTLRKWIENGIQPITVSLNFSRSTLLATDLIDSMSLIYQKYNVPKHLVEIEITESFGEMEKETVVQIAYKIVNMGYRLSLDDFGSKYSNISILSAIKLNALKLDKSIVDDLFSNNNTRIVVKNFLRICKELEIESVAEGVETEEQLAILREFGCDMAQGYLFNKPIPLEDFEEKYLNYTLV